ncbi:MAG TPA: SDR family NAD(P)-dependent oxidoreductase, partial [Anaerolineae bacterium]|nr:SDR family NAD(P)-dependent oxidoreductase [Anaerolineae bacterium]
MGENVLVTGGAGFIGSHLVDKLREQGANVRVLDNLESQVHGDLASIGQWPGYCDNDAEYILGDVRNSDVLRKVLADIDVVFHFAAMVGVGQSMYEVHRYTDV